MKNPRGSFNEKNKPPIAPKNRPQAADGGLLQLHIQDMRAVDPIPNSWIMLKPADVFVSQSGTIRILLRKNWEAGSADCLKFRCDNEGEKMGAGLDLEKININSSNFENLLFVLRDVNHSNLPDLTPDYFNKTVRYNILCLLGFGAVGSNLHSALPFSHDETSPGEIDLFILCDAKNGKFRDIFRDIDDEKLEEINADLKSTLVKITWARENSRDLYRIVNFEYPGGTPAIAIETITLASEVANNLSFASDLLAELLEEREQIEP